MTSAIKTIAWNISAWLLGERVETLNTFVNVSAYKQP